MNSPKTCQLCGRTFYPDAHWKTLCLPCYKKTKARENEATSELTELRSENYRLRSMLTHSHGAIPPGILNSLIRLAHPDRHGNSKAANDATAWLLSQRGAA